MFFRFDPERVHDRMTALGERLGGCRLSRAIIKSALQYEDAFLEQELWGIHFQNPVGLSAGFDKDSRLYPILGSVGFGFAETGTVTLGAYEGNPKPRLYRLPRSQGIIVNYGLKSRGAQVVIQTMRTQPRSIPRIISIGRTNSRITADTEAGIADYISCLRSFIAVDLGDAYEINISCPNTFGGEPFSNLERLSSLLEKVRQAGPSKPVFLKMPINLSWEEFRDLLDVALAFNIQAVTIGNLNKDRTTLQDPVPDFVRGGVSGKPTWQLSNDLIARTYQYCGDRLKIIGVGGIFSAEDAYEKIKRGASLVELITGMIFEGPQLIGDINHGLAALLKRDGYHHVSETVGAHHILKDKETHPANIGCGSGDHQKTL